MPFDDPELEEFLGQDPEKKKISFTPDSPVSQGSDQGLKSLMGDIEKKRAETAEQGRTARLYGGLGEAASQIATGGRATPSDQQFFRGIADQGSKYDKELDEYVNSKLEGHKLEILGRKKGEPVKKHYSYEKDASGKLVGINTADPSDVINTGVTPFKEPDKNAKPTDYTGKLAALPATEKGRFDNVRMASNSLRKMKNALESGVDRYSPIGDNEYTTNLTLFNEALGRMQSGGAINKDEEARFKSMARSYFDDPETSKSKLDNLIAEMDSRMTTLGFKPDEIQDPEYVKSRNLKPTVTPPPGEAIAGPGKKTPVKKQYSQKQNKTKITYSDGTEEIVDGKK